MGENLILLLLTAPRVNAGETTGNQFTIVEGLSGGSMSCAAERSTIRSSAGVAAGSPLPVRTQRNAGSVPPQLFSWMPATRAPFLLSKDFCTLPRTLHWPYGTKRLNMK